MAGRSSRSNVPPRMSLGRPSLSRRSSAAYGKSSQPRADPRPVNDKHFQTASMRRIVEYLTTHGYSYPISPKLLPSGKEIHHMIEFLFQQYDRNYRLQKLEDDVPAFFKMIGYPCQISKSALYAAGSPHSWPNLLAALTWLVELLNCNEILAQHKGDSDDQYETFASESYRHFMEGDDAACVDLDEQLQQQADVQTSEARAQAEEISKQVTELAARLQSLKSEPSPILALETKKSMLVSDVGKFNVAIQNFSAHKASLEKRLELRRHQVESKKADVAQVDAEIQALMERISSQTVNVEEFEKMSRERQRIEEELELVSASRKEKEKEAWDLEVLASKNLKKLDEIAVKCNDAMSRLKISNPEASSTAGNSFKIVLNPTGETREDLIGADIKHAIRPHLAVLLEECEKGERDKWKESTDLLKEIHAKEDALQEKKAVYAQSEAKLKELEATYKKGQAKLEATKSAEIEIRIQIEEEEEKLRVIQSESAERLERAKQEFEELQITCQNEIQEEAASLYAVIEAVMSHCEQIQSGNAMLKRQVDELEELVNNNYVRTNKHLWSTNSEAGTKEN